VTNPLLPPGHSRESFPTTRWSLVLEAGDADVDAHEALAELCRTYWYPVYAFIRRTGYDANDAEDLTQSYFARLLEKGVITAADQRKGRFRAFLRTDCHHFLIDQHRRRSGERAVARTSIDTSDGEGRYQYEPVDRDTPDRILDRAWAVTLLGRVLELLGDEYARSGRSLVFDHLKVVLVEGGRSVSAATLAARLGLSENAVNVAVHRLRKRYRAILEEQVAATLDDPAEIADEIRSLFDALTK
jgi:RNA polymerase sigma-70 factor (ECF subfamily)